MHPITGNDSDNDYPRHTLLAVDFQRERDGIVIRVLHPITDNDTDSPHHILPAVDFEWRQDGIVIGVLHPIWDNDTDFPRCTLPLPLPVLHKGLIK